MAPYNDFYAGQQVVCIDDTYHRVSIDQIIRKGEVYTIRWVGMSKNYIDGEFLGVRLAEIVRGEDPAGYGEDDMPYAARRFRPVVKDRLATFRSLMAGGPVQGGFEEPRRKAPVKEEEKV